MSSKNLFEVLSSRGDNPFAIVAIIVRVDFNMWWNYPRLSPRFQLAVEILSIVNLSRRIAIAPIKIEYIRSEWSAALFTRQTVAREIGRANYYNGLQTKERRRTRRKRVNKEKEHVFPCKLNRSRRIVHTIVVW